MAPRSQFVRLSDILDDIDAVTEMIEGMDLAGYSRDIKLRRGRAMCRDHLRGKPAHSDAFEE